MIWNKEIECADRETMRGLQLEKLKKTVKYEYDNVPYYRQKMDEKGVKPEDIKTLEDITKLPFTTKEDLAANYPRGLFAAKNEDIIRVHASSGTTGKPKVAGYTKHDLDIWGEVVARAMTAAGQDNKSIIQVAYGYGLFTGGLGAHIGAETIGATVIPMSSGNTQKQIMFMQDLKSTALACTPSYALTIAEGVAKAGIDPQDLPLQAGIFGAEPWTQGMKESIEKGLGIKAYDIYGLTEIIGPGVSISCDENNGMHIQEDYFYPEIVDPDTLEPLPDGQIGELVFTTLGKEGFPMMVQDKGSVLSDERKVRLRKDDGEDEQDTGKDRRHAYHKRCECVPFTDRRSHIQIRGAYHQLHDLCGQGEQQGHLRPGRGAGSWSGNRRYQIHRRAERQTEPRSERYAGHRLQGQIPQRGNAAQERRKSSES